MYDTQIVHVRDRRRQLSGVESRMPFFQLPESLALDEAAQVASTNKFCYQIIQVTVLETKKENLVTLLHCFLVFVLI